MVDKWIITTPNMGAAEIEDTIDDLTGTPFKLGAEVDAWHPYLGHARFKLLKGVASLAAGNWVSYNGYTGVTTRWAGTANTGRPLAVSMSANTSASVFS